MSPPDGSPTAPPPSRAIATYAYSRRCDVPLDRLGPDPRSCRPECPHPCRRVRVPTNGPLSVATGAARTAKASDASAAAVQPGGLHRPHRPSSIRGWASASDWARSSIRRNWTAVSHASIRGLPGSSGREGRADSRGPGECQPPNLRWLRSTATAVRVPFDQSPSGATGDAVGRTGILAEADDSSDDNDDDTGHSPHQDAGPTRAGIRLVSTSA
jgi:hypothetical protein